MKITALIENDRVEDRDDLCPEFGLSLHVEVNGSKILFDMGSSDLTFDHLRSTLIISTSSWVISEFVVRNIGRNHRNLIKFGSF